MCEQNAFVFRLNEHGQGPELIQQVFLEKGWREFDEDEMDDSDWNMWWRTSRFRNSDYDEIYPWQRLNHYPKSTAITKKDSLARNLKRMKGVYGAIVYNFSPVAFNLPNDYTKYVSDYTKLKEKAPDKPLYWICKPADLSRGRGIFIFRELSELQYDCNAVVQQYITNPMLIGGYKFDLRIYVLVPSFHPLTIYIYQEGLVRFSTEKYDLTHLGNMFSHLTNTSINKHSPSYGTDKERVGPGCKWTLTQLRHYLRQSNIDDSVLWTKIMNIIILTLIIQANQVPKTANCFELYGFDVMIDEKMKPWLLEVNFSPALSSDCQTDLVVKKPLLHDLIDIMGYTEGDKIRGGREFHERQVHLDRNYPSSNPRSSRGQRKSASRQPNRKPVNRLPDITTSSNNNLATYSQKRHKFNQTQSRQEYDGEGEEDIVPIIPGCGLPSVQQPLPRPNSSSSSGRSSAGSPTEEGKVFVRRSQTPSTPQMTNRSTKSHPPFERSNSNRSWKLSMSESRPGSQRIVKRESKGSMNSDSAISSYSGSSDNSDIIPLNGDHVVRKASPLTKPGARKVSRERLFSTPQKSKANKPPAGPSSTSKSGLAKISSVINYEIEAKGSSTVAPTLKTSPKNATLRKGLPNQKRNTTISYTANPIHAKSALLNRRGSLNNMSQNKTQGYLTPWLRTKSTPSNRLSIEKPSSTTFRPRCGDFFLAFPFNDVLRKSCIGNLDTRVVIRECQKLVKEKLAQAQEEKTAKKKYGEEFKPSAKKESSVSDVPPVWGALTVEPEAC